jgi:Peptidase C13 family
MDRILSQVARIIWDAVLYLIPMKKHSAQPHVSRTSLILVAIIFVAVSICAAIPFLSADWEFNEYGISTVFAQTGIAAATCCLAAFAKISSRRLLAYVLSLAAVYLIAIALMIRISISVYKYFPSLPHWVYYSTWLMLAVWILTGAFRAGANTKQTFSVTGGAVSAIALLATFAIIPNSAMLYSSTSPEGRSDVWYFARLASTPQTEDRSSAEATSPQFDWEAALADQPQMIQSTIDEIKSSDNEAHVYFIGMAPYSGQAVFSREVKASREIFDKHFGTEKRSIVLLNSQEPSEVTPIASATNLKALAAGLKSKINLERDVIVLFITSHGTRDLLSVDQYPIPFNQITPTDIKQTLEATGARNRLVIISACFSGSFIDDLKDENTAVITAASEDRTSFGCSNERDWTFFTNALFNHGFRKSRDIKQAFTLASELVKTWEGKQKLEPSRPQIFLGKQFETAWKNLIPTFDQSVSEPLVTPETADASQLKQSN